MNDETTRIAERYGITEKCSLLEHDLLGIDGVTSVERSEEQRGLTSSSNSYS